jgi:outer membrane protein assembly factor BamB
MARDGDLRKSHGTPLIANVGGKPQLISVGAKASYGYEPRTGKELWRVEYNDWSSAPRPLFENGLAYIVTGLRTKEMWAVKPDGQGNVTDTHVAWKLATHIGKYASPLLVDGLIYTPAEESFVTCLEAATGKVVWTERIGGKYAASPIYADGRLYFPSQEGVMTVLKPSRTFEALATNRLDAGFMASPAADGKALYLRTRTHLYRVESGANASATKAVSLKVVKVDSEETIGENARGSNAVDGNPATIWHTEWEADTDSLSSSHEIVIELTPASRIKGFTYLPRQDSQENGTIKRYEFYVSNDAEDFGPSVAKGEFARGKELKTVTFDAKPARLVKLRARSEVNGQNWTSAAEIGVIAE